MLASNSLKRNPTLSSATNKKWKKENILKVELLLYIGQRSKKAGSSKQRVNYNVIIGGTVTYPITYLLGFSIEKFWWDSVQIFIHRLGIGPGPWRWAWWLLHLTHNPTLLLFFFHLRVTHLVLHLSPTSLIMHGKFLKLTPSLDPWEKHQKFWAIFANFPLVFENQVFDRKGWLPFGEEQRSWREWRRRSGTNPQ